MTLCDHVLMTRLDAQALACIDGAVAAGIAKFGTADVLVNTAT